MLTIYIRLAIAILTILLAHKFLGNWIKVAKLHKYKANYKNYTLNTINQSTYSNSEAIRLFEEAKLPEPKYMFSQGLNKGLVSTWKNMHMFNSYEIYYANMLSFDKAIDYYKARRNEVLSLPYWIEFFIFLPRNLVQSLGLETQKSTGKFAEILVLILELIVACLSIYSLL